MIIFILNGSNGCGKDTFVNLVQKCAGTLPAPYPHCSVAVFHISTVTPIKQSIPDIMSHLDPNIRFEDIETSIDDLKRSIDWNEKYRMLIYKMKQALDDFNDYTTQYVIREIQKITDGLIDLYSKLPSSTSYVTDVYPVIFVDCREPEKIEHLRHELISAYDHGVFARAVTEETLIIHTVLIKGRDWQTGTAPTVANNPADKRVDKYHYTHVILNEFHLGSFYQVASDFYKEVICDTLIKAIRDEAQE